MDSRKQNANWRVGVLLAGATGSILFQGSCSSSLEAVATSLEAVAGTIDTIQGSDDISFADWLNSELND